MDYQRIYKNLVSYKDRELSIEEIHHILPKSLGGDDSPENLVKLTPREHYIAHKLLVKITTGSDKQKMVFALWRMTNGNDIKSSHMYERVRSEFVKTLSEYRTGKTFTKHSLKAIEKARARSIGTNNNMYGKHHSDDAKSKISKSKKGTMTGDKNPFYGKTHSRETIAEIARKSSEAQKGIPKIKSKCPHCNELFAPNTMARYHGDRCKQFNQ